LEPIRSLLALLRLPVKIAALAINKLMLLVMSGD
jgi:hypothetical protein